MVESTIIDYIPRFIDYLDVVKGLSEKSVKNYGQFLTPFSSWLRANGHAALLPDQITDELVYQYRVHLSRAAGAQGQGLKKSTQNYYLIALRALLAYFAQQHLVSLPVERVTLSRQSRTRQVKFLDLEKIKKLLEMPDVKTERGLRDRAVLEVLFSTGMRVGELVGLNRDVLPSSHAPGADRELAIVGKGGVARTVYLSPRSCEWVGRYLQRRTDHDPALFINYSRASRGDRRLTIRSIETSVKSYARRAGIDLRTTPHTLRHSYATDLLSQGVDLRTIQEFLGHRNILTTQIYTHVTNRKLRDVHRKFHSLRNDQ